MSLMLASSPSLLIILWILVTVSSCSHAASLFSELAPPGKVSGLAAGDQTGFTVRLSADGSTAAIGNPFKQPSGTVSIYVSSGGQYVFQDELSSHDSTQPTVAFRMGMALAISANGIHVAAGSSTSSPDDGIRPRMDVYESRSNLGTRRRDASVAA